MVVGGLLAVAPLPASAQATQTYAAYGSGDSVALNALTLGNTTVANLRAATSGGAVNTGGLQGITNELGQNVVPTNAGKNAYGRGAGLEAGLITTTPQSNTDLNQIIASSLAQEFAPPNQPPDPVVAEIAAPVNPVLYASVLRGEANAIFDPVYCPVGKPLTYGLGNATNLQLVNLSGTTNPDGSFTGPLLGTSTAQGGVQRAVNQSRTVTYMQPNGDGTFALVSETQQTLAPITLLAGGGLNTGLTIEVDGPVGFRVVANGKTGGATASYTGNPLITISSNVAGVTTPLTSTHLQDITGPNGLQLGIPGVLTVSLAAPPRAIGSVQSPAPPVLAANGTSAAAAVDLLRVTLLGVAGTPPVLDLAEGHMEGSVSVPSGGLTCTIPVSKSASVDPVTVGNPFQYKISIPADTAQYAALFDCDLINISATDTVTTQSGSPRIELVGADHGGVISGNTVTWASLGNYTLGQAPIVLTIDARIPTNSGAGVLQDKVNVNATFGNCRGGTAIGSDIIKGSAKIDGSAVTGSVTLVGPNVSRGELAATGGNSWPLVAGGGFLLAALGLVRLRRRAVITDNRATTT